jgi:hypothetical protein
MSKSLVQYKGAVRTINRQPLQRKEIVLHVVLLLSFGWFIGWVPYDESDWIRHSIGTLFVAIPIWAFVYAAKYKNYCQINTRKKTVVSVNTTLSFKTTTTHYPWDRFCMVRTVLADNGDFRVNRVELVAKEMHSVLTVAFFPAVAQPHKRSLIDVREYENPLAIELRTELAQLMSFINQGYIQEHDLLQLK